MQMMLVCFLVLLVGLAGGSMEGNAGNYNDSQPHFDRQCHCQDQGLSQVYDCTIVGTAATAWTGSAFINQCPINYIILRHSLFNFIDSESGFPDYHVDCNGGTIIASAIGVVDNRFTSQLNLTITQNSTLRNKTVQCEDNNGHIVGSSETVGYESLVLQIDTSVHGVLNFVWSNVSQINECPDVLYHINVTNCGQCPNITTTSLTMFTCINITDVLPYYHVCTFSIRATVCGFYYGSTSSVYASLSVPHIDKVYLIPEYFQEETMESQSRSHLHYINSHFNTTSPFNISDGVDGSPFSYTLEYYSDLMSTFPCLSHTIMADSCINGVCIHNFNVVASPCSSLTTLGVRVFATNVLGNGTARTSLPKSIEFVDTMVYVKMDIENGTIKCIHNKSQYRSCAITAVYETHQIYCNIATNLSESIIDNMSTSDTYNIGHLPQNRHFCFEAVATNLESITRVVLKGIFIKSFSSSVHVDGGDKTIIITGTVSLLAILLLTTIGIILCAVIICRRKGAGPKLSNHCSQSDGKSSKTWIQQPACAKLKEQPVVYADVHISHSSSNYLKQTLHAENDNVELYYAEIGHDLIFVSEERNKGISLHCKNSERSVNNNVPCNLDTILIFLQKEVTAKWFNLGIAAGMDSDTLSKCTQCTPKDCIVEVIHYWLSAHNYAVTWKDVAELLTKAELHQLATAAMGYHETGQLPPDLDTEL